MTYLQRFINEGYLVLRIFNNLDIDNFKNLISYKLNDLKKENIFKSSNLKNYHKLIKSNNEHLNLVKGVTRNFDIDFVSKNKIKKNKHLHNIVKHYWGHNNFSILHKVNDNIFENKSVFRVARPCNKYSDDVGGVHIDGHINGKIRNKNNFINLFTIWTPLEGFSKKSSLKIFPKSHIRTHSSNNLNFQKKYISILFKDEYISKFKSLRLNLKKGESIILHPNLLHGGSFNHTNLTRISMDFRIFNLKNKIEI